jgi:hypothetical protein
VYVKINLQRVVHVGSQLAFWSTTLTLAISVLRMPLLGALSDTVGRKPVFIVGSLAAAVAAVPCFVFMNAGGVTAAAMQIVLELVESALMGVATIAASLLDTISPDRTQALAVRLCRRVACSSHIEPGTANRNAQIDLRVALLSHTLFRSCGVFPHRRRSDCGQPADCQDFRANWLPD